MRLPKKSIVDVPKLLKEWDYPKNASLNLFPDKISLASKEKVYWKCSKGHCWPASIRNRYYLKRGCPVCANHIVVKGYNDLATTDPKISKEWDEKKNFPLTPKDVTRGSSKKVGWICPEGHHYDATVYHRTSGRTNCPICNSGRQTSFREQAFYFYLKKKFPDAISRYKAEWLGKFELDIYIPSIRQAIEYDGVAWHKSEKREREIRKYELCRRHRIKLLRIKEKMPHNSYSIADQCISVENIENLKQFENLIVEVVRILYSTFYAQTYKDLACPVDVNLERDDLLIRTYCTKVKGSLEELRPDLAAEWNKDKNGEIKPNMVKVNCGHKHWWTCSICGNIYKMSPITRNLGGCGCPKCAKDKQKQTRHKNHLMTHGHFDNQYLLEEWDYYNNKIKPEDCTKHSNYKAKWICKKCGARFESTISNRTEGKGCPVCCGRKVVYGINDLETWCIKNNKINILNDWNDLEVSPREVTKGSNKKIRFKCSICGNEYISDPNHMTSAKGNGCRKCADNKNRKSKSKPLCNTQNNKNDKLIV